MNPISSSKTLRALLSAMPFLTVTACNSSDVMAPPPPERGEFTIDARTGWVYVSLADSTVVSPGSPNWDLAFFATNVTLNGGRAGRGGVQGACICQNASATNEDVLAMTSATEKDDFDAVTAVPSTTSWTSETLTPAISGWFTGTGTAAVAAPTKTYLVRLADSVGYAKVRVTRIDSPTATHAGRVTLEYAVQPSPTASLGSVQTTTMELTQSGSVYLDLNPSDGVPIGTGWDLLFEGFDIKVNGGVSGTGKGAAALVADAFESVSSAKIADQAYRTDVYSGVFNTHRFYRYNISGDNRISPTYDVYLVRRGDAVYKVQITGYYNAAGQARHVTFRYARIGNGI